MLNNELKTDVNIEEIAKRTEDLTGAELKAICTEAGMFAIREDHYSISRRNFDRAVEKGKKSENLTQLKEMGAMFV